MTGPILGLIPEFLDALTQPVRQMAVISLLAELRHERKRTMRVLVGQGGAGVGSAGKSLCHAKKQRVRACFQSCSLS